ncbi:MAG: nucleotidyltransferase [Bacteroidota bacterium]
MVKLFAQHEKVIRVLNSHHVRFLVIGGYAVNFHGFVRPTGDIDLWLEPTEENKILFLQAIQSLGISEQARKKVELKDFRSFTAFHLGQEPYRVDFLTLINGVLFSDAVKDKIEITLGDVCIPFISRKHLIVSKISNDRTQDKLDVEKLQQITK